MRCLSWEKKHCCSCGSLQVKRNGKTKQNKQRYQCRLCLKTFIWKRPDAKQFNEQHWFKLWITESYSIRQLSKLSGHSPSKLKRIKNYWLHQEPQESHDHIKHKHLLFDGTYFHKNGCLVNLMTHAQTVIAYRYVDKESYYNVHPWFSHLKEQGLSPHSVTMDGHLKVIEAIKEVWPKTIIQRCLYHIQRQGLQWLRTYPKTEAGKKLRSLLLTLCSIRSIKERNTFIQTYEDWLFKYKSFVRTLPRTSVAFIDLKRTMGLITNAIPNMFYYLNHSKIPATTNSLEGFYSRLKSDYQRHRGLSQKNRIQYLKWYCYFKNSNTFWPLCPSWALAKDLVFSLPTRFFGRSAPSEWQNGHFKRFWHSLCAGMT